MPHLDSMTWDEADRLHSVKRGTTTAWYAYDAGGQRTRKVVEKQESVREERIYLGGFELFRKYAGSSLELERETLHIIDDQQRIALVETKTLDASIPAFTEETRFRYQLSNHL